jgi:4-hydroxy-tetrahydrodipicolinate synthase
MIENIRTDFSGVWTALVSPFHSSGSGIDESLWRRLIERQIEAHVSAIVVAGSTGEGQTLTLEEWSQLLKGASLYRDQIHVCAACSSSSTSQSKEMLRRAIDLGAQSALVATPPYNKPMPQGIVAHFQEISSVQKNFPIVVYNIPGRSGTNISPETMAMLWKIPEVVALKESSGNWSQFLDLVAQLPPEKYILCGDDPFNVAMITHGASGTVSVLSNVIPKAVVDLVEAASFSRMGEAMEIFYSSLGLTKALFSESNPIPVKYAVSLLLEQPLALRLPLTPLSEAHQKWIRNEMSRLGVLS